MQQALAGLFQQVFRDEMENNGHIPVVEEPAADVLSVKVQLIDLDITHVDDLNESGRTRTFVTSAGSVTMIGDLANSSSGEPLARVEDHRAARSITDFQISNRVTNTAEARQAVRYWAGLLRDRMTAIDAGG